MKEEELLEWLDEARKYFTEVMGATSFKKLTMENNVEVNRVDVSKKMQQGIIEKGNQAHKEIAAILKNQPTITKRDIEGWADKARDCVERETNWACVEDVMKEMLTEIGVSITVDVETVAKRLAKKYDRNILDPHRKSGK